MPTNGYDVIVVGARSAGAPTAMLLARSGHRVLVVDRATFPSDTVSTHLVHPPGVAAWRRWGVFDRDRRHRLSTDPHVCVRLRTVHADRLAGRGRRDRVVRAASDGARQDPRRRRRRGRRRGPRRIHGRWSGVRRRSRHGDPRPRPGRSDGGRAGDDRGRSRRAALHGGRGGRRRGVRRATAAAGELLRVLERPADGWPVRDVHPARRGLRGVADQ